MAILENNSPRLRARESIRLGNTPYLISGATVDNTES